MVDCAGSGRRMASGGEWKRHLDFTKGVMAISTVLKIIVVACIAGLSSSTSTSSNVTTTDVAPSVVGHSTTTAQILTELGIALPTSNSRPEVVIPETPQDQGANASESSSHGLQISTEASLQTDPENGGPAAAVTAGRSPDVPPSGTATGTAADVYRPRTAYPLPKPIINDVSIEVMANTISMCLVDPVGPEGSVTYYLVTESLQSGARTRNGSHDLVNGTTICLRKRDLVGGTLYGVHVMAYDDDHGRSLSEPFNITTDIAPIVLELDPVLELLDGNTTRVTIDWSFRNATFIDKFIFSYNQTDDYPGGFLQHEPITLSGTRRNVTLTGIYPGASYALSLEGFSGPKKTTIARRWIPETEPPSHVTARATTTTTMELTWTFPPHTPRSLVRHFLVTYRHASIGHWRHESYSARQTTLTRIVLENLLPDTTYEVNVTTISVCGRPSFARMINHQTAIAPPLIMSSSATTTSFTLVWETPRGHYHHVVSCSGCPLRTQTLNPGVTRFTFGGLRPGNMYNGTMVAVKDSLVRSDPTFFRELTYPVGPPSVQVRLLDHYGTRLEVTWSATLCYGCEVDSYKTALVVTKTSRRLYWNGSDCLVGTCRMVYYSLEPGQEYYAEVRAVRLNLSSDPPTLSRDIRIPPAKPGPITFTKVTHDQISISWSPSYGEVDKYVLSICQLGLHPSADCFYRIEVNSSTTEFKCLELMPSTSYNFSLSAKAGRLTSAVLAVVKATTAHFPAVDSRPPKAPRISDVTPYTFPVTFDTSFFDDTNEDILFYTVLVAEASAVSHANLPKYGNLSEGLQTRTWARAIGMETIQRYQIADRYSYEELLSGSGKRDVYAQKTIIVGSEDCSEEEKDVYCNGPLKHNKIYVYQFRAFTATGYADTQFSHHVMLPEDNTGVVAGISVVLILLFLIVLILIAVIMGRKFRGNYGKYMAARSLEPLPVGVMTHASTSRRVSRPVRLTDFCHDFQVMNAHCHYGFSREYESVMKVGRKLTCNAAVLAPNVSKNRYTNILPFDRTRVMLSPIDDVEGSDYINANYIPGYVSPREYIACQGPLPATVDDMWRLIWEHDVATVVMLTQLVEKATVKCDQYWEDDHLPYLHGEIQVTLIGTSELEHWTIRDFTLEKGDTTKKVRHFHYLAWPDHGVPDSSTALLNFIRTVRKQIPKNGTPTVVHCSAGVGRTGTFVCLDRLMKHMEEFDFVDILCVTCDLRMHRSYMVQTEQQYVFIHKCVLDMLEEKGIVSKRLPSISSIDTCDMASTRQGSDASTCKRRLSDAEGDAGDAVDLVVFRQRSFQEDDEDTDKRFSIYSMGSPKRSLIEDHSEGKASASPKRSGSSNGSAKMASKHMKEECL